MGAPIAIKWDEMQSATFAAHIDEMQRLTGAEVPKIVRNIGRDYVRAAVKVTPIAKTTQKSDYRRRQDGTFYKLPKPKGYKVWGRGFAKAGWIKAFAGLGISAQKEPPAKDVRRGNKAFRFGVFRDGRHRPNPFVEVGNAVPYIGKLDRDERIQQRALHIATVRTENKLRELSNELANKWRS
jgi:hypothetical protein